MDWRQPISYHRLLNEPLALCVRESASDGICRKLPVLTFCRRFEKIEIFQCGRWPSACSAHVFRMFCSSWSGVRKQTNRRCFTQLSLSLFLRLAHLAHRNCYYVMGRFCRHRRRLDLRLINVRGQNYRYGKSVNINYDSVSLVNIQCVCGWHRKLTFKQQHRTWLIILRLHICLRNETKKIKCLHTHSHAHTQIHTNWKSSLIFYFCPVGRSVGRNDDTRA